MGVLNLLPEFTMDGRERPPLATIFITMVRAHNPH